MLENQVLEPQDSAKAPKCAHLPNERGGFHHPSKSHDLVDRIRKRNPAALEELYRMVNNFSYFLIRQLGRDDLQDNIHDVFLTVTQAITDGKLRDPDRLSAFLTTVTRFYTYSQIEKRVQTRTRMAGLDDIDVADAGNLEISAYRRQKMSMVREILRSMPLINSEILRRFYLEEQSKEQICRDLKLTPTQFRNIKSQAKLALAKLGQRKLAPAFRMLAPQAA
jgi:RNA polymerase sigma-70 factor (ECF subfamily)